MKLLFIFLACIAATNAAIYYNRCGYSYRYFYRKHFCVYPRPSSFCFNVYYKTNWCSYRYYAPVLKFYPGNTCGTEGWTEKPVPEVLTEMENALKESLRKITEKMNEKRDAWKESLKACIESYKIKHTDYMTKYYAYLIECTTDEAEKQKLRDARDQKIKEYNDKMDQMKLEAEEKYQDSIDEKLKQIGEYHKKLLANAKTCLDTRLTKITDYESSIKTKIDGYVENFHKYLFAILEKNVVYYRTLLDRVHGEGFEKEKTDAVVLLYRKNEEKKVDDIVKEYSEKVGEYKLKLVRYYRCSYRCYLSTSCLRFYKKYYYRTCKSLGCWYRFKTNYCLQRYCINKFSYCYRRRTYSGLKTCEKMPVKTVAEITEPLMEKLKAYIKSVTEKCNAWKAKWETYHEEYVKCLEEIIKKRHAWHIQYRTSQYICINNSQELTEEQKAEIDRITEELAEKRKTKIEEYKKKLEACRKDCETKFNDGIEKYRIKVEDMIEKIGEQYQDCVDNRDKKIAEYKKKLEDQRDAEKKRMEEDMKERKNKWIENVYKPMYESFHETKAPEFPQEILDLINAHTLKLQEYCAALLKQCKDHWDDILPKLVHHFSCCYNCKATFCMPTYCFGGYYRWTVKYPSACYYPYYYKTYRRCYSYRIRYYKYPKSGYKYAHKYKYPKSGYKYAYPKSGYKYAYKYKYPKSGYKYKHPKSGYKYAYKYKYPKSGYKYAYKYKYSKSGYKYASPKSGYKYIYC